MGLACGQGGVQGSAGRLEVPRFHGRLISGRIPAAPRMCEEEWLAELEEHLGGLAGNLEVGYEVEGELTSDDTIDGESGEIWLLRASAGDRLAIEVESEDFYPIVAVVGPGIAEADDDSGLGSNARLVFVVAEDGEYRVVIIAVAFESIGSFRLRAVRAAALKGEGEVGDTKTGSCHRRYKYGHLALRLRAVMTECPDSEAPCGLGQVLHW